METYVKVGNLSTKMTTKAQLDSLILLEFPRYVFPEAGIGFGVPRLDRDGSPMVGTVPGKELSE